MKVEVLAEVTTRNVVAVELQVTVGNETVTTTGSAQRDPDDKPNEQIGLLLAYGRALESAGKRLLRRGNGLVEHAAHIAESERGADPFRALLPGATVTTTESSGNGVTYTISFGKRSEPHHNED